MIAYARFVATPAVILSILCISIAAASPALAQSAAPTFPKASLEFRAGHRRGRVELLGREPSGMMRPFWAMPSIGGDADAAVGGGTTWILEWRQGSRYHVVSRWQPQTGPFVETAHLVLHLAGVSEEELGPDAPNVPMRPPRPQPGDPPPPSRDERSR